MCGAADDAGCFVDADPLLLLCFSQQLLLVPGEEGILVNCPSKDPSSNVKGDI